MWKKCDGSVVGTGIFNGDVGTILSIDPSVETMTILFDDREAEYDFDMLRELELAYAMTVHKSQGSEFDVVIIPVVAGAPMLLTKNLLYTAVTRAKKMVVLIGTKQCIARMVKNKYETVRFTMLKYFLKLDGEPYEAK